MVDASLVNVEAGDRLVRLMDHAGEPPLAALWVYSADHERWRLWLVPRTGARTNQIKENYLKIAELMSENWDELLGLDIGDIEFVENLHPAIAGLSKSLRIEGLGRVPLHGQLIDGYYLPESIVMRMAG
jgi:hypothetical protein